MQTDATMLESMGDSAKLTKIKYFFEGVGSIQSVWNSGK
jgi:hypothetical protein